MAHTADTPAGPTKYVLPYTLKGFRGAFHSAHDVQLAGGSGISVAGAAAAGAGGAGFDCACASEAAATRARTNAIGVDGRRRDIRRF